MNWLCTKLGSRQILRRSWDIRCTACCRCLRVIWWGYCGWCCFRRGAVRLFFLLFEEVVYMPTGVVAAGECISRLSGLLPGIIYRGTLGLKRMFVRRDPVRRGFGLGYRRLWLGWVIYRYQGVLGLGNLTTGIISPNQRIQSNRPFS